MTRIEFEYKGYKVHYSENEDKWNCDDLKIPADKIGTVKARIDKVLLAARKQAAFECARLSYGGSETVQLKVIEYKGKREVRSGTWGKPSTDTVIEVYTMTDKGGRTIEKLHELVHYGPELDAFEVLRERNKAEIKRLTKEMDTAAAALPRVTEADIAELVRIHEAEQNGQEMTG